MIVLNYIDYPNHMKKPKVLSYSDALKKIMDKRPNASIQLCKAAPRPFYVIQEKIGKVKNKHDDLLVLLEASESISFYGDTKKEIAIYLK